MTCPCLGGFNWTPNLSPFYFLGASKKVTPSYPSILLAVLKGHHQENHNPYSFFIINYYYYFFGGGQKKDPYGALFARAVDRSLDPAPWFWEVAAAFPTEPRELRRSRAAAFSVGAWMLGPLAEAESRGGDGGGEPTCGLVASWQREATKPTTCLMLGF